METWLENKTSLTLFISKQNLFVHILFSIFIGVILGEYNHGFGNAGD